MVNLSFFSFYFTVVAALVIHWTTDDPNSNNSQHVVEIVSRWPESWRVQPYKLLFTAVVDDSYMHFADIFINSLLNLNYSKADIALMFVHLMLFMVQIASSAVFVSR